MARNDPDEEVAPARKGPATIHDRIAAFAMLDAMKDATQAQKSLRLSLVGFTNGEIAQMLQTTPAVVAQNLYNERRKAGKKPAGKKGAPEESGTA
jgi:hypothetical protein